MITIVMPRYDILTPVTSITAMPCELEQYGRVCYKSEDRIKPDSAARFVRMLCNRNHVSVLEHCSISVRVICSRACSHQLVRHRICSFSQRSMRYVKPTEPVVICPPSIGLDAGEYVWSPNKLCWESLQGETVFPNPQGFLTSVYEAFEEYKCLIENGIKPEDARFILPIATETELVVTMNLRMWRHVFRERALNPAAQWEIRGVFKGIYDEFKVLLPCVFDDLA